MIQGCNLSPLLFVIALDRVVTTAVDNLIIKEEDSNGICRIGWETSLHRWKASLRYASASGPTCGGKYTRSLRTRQGKQGRPFSG